MNDKSSTNVLHICSYYYGTKLYRSLMDNLIKNNCNISVYGPCSYDCDYEVTEKYLIKSKCFNKLDRLFFHYKYNKIYNNLKKEISLANYTVLHAHSLFSNGYVAYKVFKNYGIPYIIAVRNTDVNVFFKYMIHLRRLGIKILENASKIIFISNSYKDKIINKYVPKSKRQNILEKSIVIPNGIDNKFLDNLGTEKKIENNRLNLVYTGRIDENKNLITTIKCVDKILKNKYDIKLNVIGEITSKRYENILKKYDFINYYGKKNKEEIIEIYKNMHIFVMPSKHETFGLAYVEAMSQGLPVIYTQNEGFDNFFEPGKVGYPIIYNNYNEMAEKIELILDNYSNISKNCLQSSLIFDWDEISKEYIKIYENLKYN